MNLIMNFKFNKQFRCVHVKMDNTVTLKYIVKIESTRNWKLTKISKERWNYLMQKGTMINFEYLPASLKFLEEKRKLCR